MLNFSGVASYPVAGNLRFICPAFRRFGWLKLILRPVLLMPLLWRGEVCGSGISPPPVGKLY